MIYFYLYRLLNRKRKMLISTKLLPLLFILLALCDAKNIHIHQCSDKLPSCGHIHNISYPFRLQSQPKKCGEPEYQLLCENNKPFVQFQGVNYSVQAINRNNLTIRLVDSSLQTHNCSSLPHSINITGDTDPFESKVFGKEWFYVSRTIVFVSCEKPMTKNTSLFIDTKPCVNGSTVKRNNSYSYVTSYPSMISDVAESCSIDRVALSSSPVRCGLNCSYSDIHDSIAYGFEFSWRFIACRKYCKRQGFCLVGDGGDVIVFCVSFYTGLLLRIGYGTATVLLYIILPILGFRFIVGVLIFSGFLIYKWRRRHLSMYDSVEEFLQAHNNLRPIKYSFSDIKKMTKGFKEKLGQGGYGTVYKGRIRSGRDVAVKVLLAKSKANDGQEFINEVATIGRIHHVNVVRLIGFCAEKSKRALVYEFMPNGSLEKHTLKNENNAPLIGYEKMWVISLGIARGIEYLHKGCDMRILHFDIKPHNILLDENFVPKVSDFGLARLYPTDGSTNVATLTAARGTIGYIAPELFYKNIGGVSHKADVYSFGMLLLEMAGKKTPHVDVERSTQIYFHSWIYDEISGERSFEIEGVTDGETRLVKKMVMIGMWCIQMRPCDRPSISKVIEMLESEIECIEMPPKPSLCVDGEPSCSVSLSVCSEISTECSSLIRHAI